MPRVFITGSTDGLGLAAARELISQGHEVVLHSRNDERAKTFAGLGDQVAGVVVGDLSSRQETLDVAEQVNALGRMDAAIHNAGIYIDPERVSTPEGHARTLAVNVLAPYILTAQIERPARLISISSGMHTSASGSLDDVDWTARRWDGTEAYCESKLLLAAFAFALAGRWPEVRSHVVDPGWVPTRMGGPSAPDDLELGHVTQAWLAVSDDPEASGSGQYWYHQSPGETHRKVTDERFQSELLARLEQLTGVALPA